MGRSWDDIINERATIDDIDPKAIKYFLRKAVDAERMPVESLNDTPEEVLDNLHLIEDGKLKMLLFCFSAKNQQDSSHVPISA